MDQNSLDQPVDSEEIHLSDYLAVLYRRRYLGFAVFALVFLGVGLFTFLSTPIFESTATLHIRDDKVKGGANLLGDLGLSRDNPIETEIEIVKSRTSIEEVVRRLNLNWVVDKKPADLEFNVVDFSSKAEKPVYTIRITGEKQFLVEDDDGKKIAEGREGELIRGGGLTLVITELQGNIGDSCRITLNSFNQTVSDLREQVRVSEVGKGTNIIRVSYQNADPRRSRDVVNTLSQVYLERSILLKTEEASRSVEFIGEQLEKVRETLEGAEKNLENFKSLHGVIQLDAEAQALITRMSELEKQKAETLLRIQQAEFAELSLRSGIDRRESYAPAVLLDEPVVASLAQNLMQLEIEKQGLLVEFAPQHPLVQAVQDRIVETQNKLLANYQTILNGLRETSQNLSRSLAIHEADLKKLPETELELARRTRLATVNAEIYIFLLQKQQEASIAKASTISNVNVIDPAILAERAVKPKKLKNLLLGGIVGLMLALGVAFFRDYLDESIRDADTVKRLFNLSILALIPYIGRKNANKKAREEGTIGPQRSLIAHIDPRSPAAEAFRSLRTALHFARKGKSSQVVMVTSSIPGEGKTTTSANLAVTLAQIGQRILLVGCDLRKPTLHQMFDTKNIPGLSDCLVGDSEPDQAVHSTGLFNLDFVSAGTVPPNPAELLDSVEFKNLINRWRETYDLILLDAPPVLAVTDAAVLNQVADMTLLVIQVGKIGRKAVARTLEILHASHAKIVGTILNDKTNKGADAYGYGEYGNYGYNLAETSKKNQKKNHSK